MARAGAMNNSFGATAACAYPQTRARGWTPTACGINLAADTLITSSNHPTKGGAYIRQVIVLMTDGQANTPCDGGSSISTGLAGNEYEGKRSANEARNYCKSKDGSFEAAG